MTGSVAMVTLTTTTTFGTWTTGAMAKMKTSPVWDMMEPGWMETSSSATMSSPWVSMTSHPAVSQTTQGFTIEEKTPGLREKGPCGHHALRHSPIWPTPWSREKRTGCPGGNLNSYGLACRKEVGEKVEEAFVKIVVLISGTGRAPGATVLLILNIWNSIQADQERRTDSLEGPEKGGLFQGGRKSRKVELLVQICHLKNWTKGTRTTVQTLTITRDPATLSCFACCLPVPPQMRSEHSFRSKESSRERSVL